VETQGAGKSSLEFSRLLAWALIVFTGTTGVATIAMCADSSADLSTLQEVVITAQRIEENAQHAALAITTISPDELLRAGVGRPGEMTALVPALQISDDTGPYSIFYLRGVGNFAANGLTDPAIRVNFDGVTVNRSGTGGLFYDLERIEVLKGPQGILYGRNATGGAINVISKRPMLGETHFDGAVDRGNYGSMRVAVMLNEPLGGASAVRLAANVTKHNGYMSDGTGDQNDAAARLSYNYAPSDAVSLLVVGDYMTQKGVNSGGTISGSSSSFLAAPRFNINQRYGLSSPQVTAYLASVPNGLDGRTFAPLQTNTFQDNKFGGVSATLDWKTSIGTVTVLPAYRKASVNYNLFASAVNLAENSTEALKSFEARLASDDRHELGYVFGLYSLTDSQNNPAFTVNQQAVLTFQQFFTEAKSRAAYANLTYAVTPTFRITGGARLTHDDKYFTATLHANTLICTRGFLACPNAAVLPYTLTTSVAPQSIPNGAGTITTLTIVDRTGAKASDVTYDKTTWRAGVALDLSDRNLLYANVETGYKSGGFFFTADANNAYRPETLRAYTVGSKNRFLDNRLQVNLELFQWNYSGQQINHVSRDSVGDAIFRTDNVGLATYKGVEVDVQARPVPHTLVTADVQYNNGRYDSFVYAVPNNNLGFSNGTGCPNLAVSATNYTVSCSGKQPPYAPRWTLGGSAQQTIPLAGAAKLVAAARAHYQSLTLTALDFLPIENQGSAASWDFDLTISARSDRYYLTGYVNNAFNRSEIQFSFAMPLSSAVSAILRPPRTYGICVGAHL